MKKTTLSYKILSNKELDFLKDTYVQDKINSMSEKDLKSFVFDCINHQIKGTIGNEEETEAWKEIENFYEDRFEALVKQIQQKFQGFTNSREETLEDHEKRSKLLETNKIESEKEDMWED